MRAWLTAGGLRRRGPRPLRKAELRPRATAAARPLEAQLLKSLLVVRPHELVEACVGRGVWACGLHRAELGGLGSRATRPHLL